MLDDTKRSYPQCRCDDLGIITDWLKVEALRKIGSGCTSGLYVCPRLDAIRRHYEKRRLI